MFNDFLLFKIENDKSIDYRIYYSLCDEKNQTSFVIIFKAK